MQSGWPGLCPEVNSMVRVYQALARWTAILRLQPFVWTIRFDGELDLIIPDPWTTDQNMASKLDVEFHGIQFEFEKKSLQIKVTSTKSSQTLTGVLCDGALPDTEPSIDRSEDKHSITFTWPNFGHLEVTHVCHETDHEYSLSWISQTGKGQFRDQFDLNPGHWYGAAEIRHQHWPIEKWIRPETAFVTGDSYKDEYGGVQERYWLSSKGFALFVDYDVPLFVGMNKNNDGRLTFTSKWASPYRNITNTTLALKYSIFTGADVKAVHILATNQKFQRPTAIPDEMVFRYPIWSTWAKYKKNINQNVVIEFAQEIKAHGFKACQIEIDDDWTPRYGDMDFDPAKFPDPKDMIEDLRGLGYRVTVWVHPFASPMSKAAGTDNWIKAGWVPGYTIWWNGIGKLLDVTKPESVTWFKASMRNLKDKYGLTSFKFDAGEANWIPNLAKPLNPWSNPSDYSRRYAQMCYECDTELRAQEVRVGVRTQHLPIFVRMLDKDSNWTFNNGLKSLIPHALTFSVLGYPFLLPDMIGGNAYPSTSYPEKELFIRWLQANVFLPVIQYSVTPWQYDDPEVNRIAKEMTELHERYADTIIALARESVRTGAPIIRPLWWVAPNDERAQTIDDEFLVGDEILVAPVVVKGATCRDVFLPPGLWQDELRQTQLEGGKWYRSYEANLDELPYFTRVEQFDGPDIFGPPEVVPSPHDWSGLSKSGSVRAFFWTTEGPAP